MAVAPDDVGAQLRVLRTQHGAVEDRYDSGKVLFVDRLR